MRYITEFIFSFPSHFYLLNYLFENCNIYNFCLSADFFRENKTIEIDFNTMNSNHVINSLVCSFLKPQLNFDHIFKIFTSDFFKVLSKFNISFH